MPRALEAELYAPHVCNITGSSKNRVVGTPLKVNAPDKAKDWMLRILILPSKPSLTV